MTIWCVETDLSFAFDGCENGCLYEVEGEQQQIDEFAKLVFDMSYTDAAEKSGVKVELIRETYNDEENITCDKVYDRQERGAI